MKRVSGPHLWPPGNRDETHDILEKCLQWKELEEELDKKGGLQRLKLNPPASQWVDGEVAPKLSFTEENQENSAEVVSIKLVKKFLETLHKRNETETAEGRSEGSKSRWEEEE